MKHPFRDRNVRPLLILCALLTIVWLRYHPRRGDASAEAGAVGIEQVRDLFPEAYTLTPLDVPYVAWQVLGEDEAILGSVVVSGPDTRRVTGYSGPTPLAIGLDTDGDVLGVLLLDNLESEGYLQDVIDDGLLESWNGLPPEQAFTKTVDAVSGATMSSSSIIETLRLTLRPLANANQSAPKPAKITVAVVAIWLVLVLDLLTYVFHRRLRKLRVVTLLLNIAVLGFFAGTMLSLAQLAGWSVNGIPRGMWLTSGAMLVLAVCLPLFARRDFYCAHVCPFGSLQELVGKLRRRKAHIPGWLSGLLRSLRGLVLATAWLSLAIGIGLDFTVAEPFAAFKFQAAPASVLVLAGVFAMLSLFVPRAWCRFLCPTGQLLSIARCHKSPEGSALVRFETLVICLLLAAAGWFAWTMAYVPEEQPNDVLSVIHSRRSVRTYTDEPVTETQLDTLLRAGMAAPTAGNAQPWSFVVVTDRAQLQSLAGGLEYGRMLTKAGAAIVVCGLPEEALPGAARDMWVLDCTAASENILLAAEGIGLGAVWVGVYPIEERVQHVRKALGLPASVVPLNVISIGHPTGVERAKNKYDPDRVRWQSWESEEP